MKAVNIKARAGGEWRHRVLELVPGWGWSHWAEPELKAGCATGGLEIYDAPTACAVPPQATAGETKREPALCGQLQPSAKRSRERQRKPGEWRERPHRKHIPAWIISASHQLPCVTFDLACVHECFANNISLSTWAPHLRLTLIDL